MGLKSKLNKMKSFLFDEEDDEKEERKVPKRSSRKETKKSEVEKDDDFSKTQEIEELYFEDVSDTKLEKTSEIRSRTLKNDHEFQFPEFDDDDFMVSSVSKDPVVKATKEEPKPVLYQGSKRKEETKKFKPSPIISPIYGLLDKDGNKVKTGGNNKENDNYDKEVSLDVVRRKAYGNLDEELENTMKRLSKKTIEEAEKDKEQEEKEITIKEEQKAKKVLEEKPIVVKEDQDDDDMILPNVNFKEIDVDKERTKKLYEKVTNDEDKQNGSEDDDDDTKEQDLFNLIDSMYQKEGQED